MADAMIAPDRSVVGVLAVEGTDTGDGRKIDTNSLRWTLPQPLRWVKEDFGAHNGAVVVGAIEKIVRTDSGELTYSGRLFDTPAGAACYDEMYTRFASSGLKFGISVDLDDVVVEDDEDTMVVKEGRLRGATLCDIPAYATAYTMLSSQIAPAAMVAAGELGEGFLAISAMLFDTAREQGLIQRTGVREEDGVVLYETTPGAVLVAAAPRSGAPESWYRNPKLDGPTPITVTPEGYVYGHAALWNTCHIGFADMCIRAPHSPTDYAYFKTGAVRTAEGTQVHVGQITMGTGHASARLAAAPAAEHYDNTGAAIADVAAGEDEFGLWLAGSVREGVTDAQIREMQAAAVSGDWRTIDGALELVAMLSVSVPGFPVPRMRAMVASGEVTSLVASAVFDSEETVEETSTEMAPEAVLESVAPEVVEEAPVAEEALAEDNIEDQPDAQDAEEESAEDVVEDEEFDAKSEISVVKDMLAQILAKLEGEKAEDEPEESEEDAEPAEAVPAEERSPEDLLAALDALVKGTPDLNALLAELDAKVGK